MDILRQLEIDHTVFIQLGLFIVVFWALSRVYFGPFLKLFEARHQKTVRDRESAEKIMAQAEEKLKDYTSQLQEARMQAKAAYQQALEEAKKQEAEILTQARGEAKKITQEASQQMEQQALQLRKSLEGEIEGMARSVSEKLLLRKV